MTMFSRVPTSQARVRSFLDGDPSGPCHATVRAAAAAAVAAALTVYLLRKKRARLESDDECWPCWYQKGLPPSLVPIKPLVGIKSLPPSLLNLHLETWRAVPINPSFEPFKMEQVARDFKARAGDVFVCSFPKAGTTWTQSILFQLAWDASPPSGFSQYATVPWVEATQCSNKTLHSRAAAGRPHHIILVKVVDYTRAYTPNRSFTRRSRGDAIPTVFQITCVAKVILEQDASPCSYLKSAHNHR